MDGTTCEQQANLADGMGTENIDELHSSFDNLQKPLGPIKEVKTTFTFTSTGSKEVYITGSFTNWREHVLMDKTSANTFTKTLSLPIGIHSYKYIIDGEWKIDPSFTTMPDSDGNINNFINVSLDYEQGFFTKIIVHFFVNFLKKLDYQQKYLRNGPIMEINQKQNTVLIHFVTIN